MVSGSGLVLVAITFHWFTGCVVALAVAIAGAHVSAQEREGMPLGINEVGLTTVRKILEVQDHLAAAQDKEIQALMHHAIALSRLDAARALSLGRYRLVPQR